MQTPEGIKKMKVTIRKKYGFTEDGKSALHVRAGRIGGQKGRTGGTYGDPEWAAEIGSIGGKRSKRGYKFVKEDKRGRHYVDKATGLVVVFNHKQTEK